MKQRIQKIIAASGQYSRRAVERLIDERKIRVNGVVVTAKGFLVDPLTDRIQIGGKNVVYRRDNGSRAILLNKPRRCLVTRSDPAGRKTIYDLIPKALSGLKPAGRLDYNSQGALILTNDGDLLLRLTHPRYHWDKVYEVKLSSHPDKRQLDRLRRGIVLDGRRTLPADVTVMRKHQTTTVLRFVLKEGKNRQIRRMCEAVGLTVKELRRVAIGPVRLKGLRSGQFRELSRRERDEIARGC